MVQILEDQPSFASQLMKSNMNAASAFAKEFMGERTKKKEFEQENEALKKYGIDLTNVRDPDIRKLITQGVMKKKEPDTEKFSTGLDVIGKMRDIAAKKNIGRGSSFMGFFPGETARDRSEFEQLGKSLIPIVAAGVPIRNQREFDEYKKVITDPSSSLSDIEGALTGLESIFQSKLNSKSANNEESEASSDLKKVRPGTPLTLEAVKKIHDTVGGDKEKARKLAKKMGYSVQ